MLDRHLQSEQIQEAAEIVQVIETVGHSHLARRLDERAAV